MNDRYNNLLRERSTSRAVQAVLWQALAVSVTFLATALIILGIVWAYRQGVDLSQPPPVDPVGGGR